MLFIKLWDKNEVLIGNSLMYEKTVQFSHKITMVVKWEIFLLCVDSTNPHNMKHLPLEVHKKETSLWYTHRQIQQLSDVALNWLFIDAVHTYHLFKLKLNQQSFLVSDVSFSWPKISIQRIT